MHAVVQTTSRTQPRIVIAGAGIGGLLVARLLAGIEAEVVVLRQSLQPARQRHFTGLFLVEDLEAIGLGDLVSAGLPVGAVVQAMRDADAEQQETVPMPCVALEHGVVLDRLEDLVTDQGVSIVDGVTVTDLAESDGRVTGVVDGVRTIDADVVVLADEADPRLAEQVGLRPDWLPTQLMHIGKVRYPAPAGAIRSRLGEADGTFRVVSLRLRSEWSAWGTALVLPGTDAITVLAAMLLEDEMVAARHIREFLDEVETVRVVASVIDGLAADGFFTEVVPVGGFDDRHRFHTDGFVIASDLVGVTHPLNRDGLSLNLRVAAAAAMAVREALRREDFGAGVLGAHSRRLVEEVTSPVHFRRRQHQRLKQRAPWEWASWPDLVPAWQEVTEGGISATLPENAVRGVWRRVRGLGREATRGPRRTRG